MKKFKDIKQHFNEYSGSVTESVDLSEDSLGDKFKRQWDRIVNPSNQVTATINDPKFKAWERDQRIEAGRGTPEDIASRDKEAVSNLDKTRADIHQKHQGSSAAPVKPSPVKIKESSRSDDAFRELEVDRTSRENGTVPLPQKSRNPETDNRFPAPNVNKTRGDEAFNTFDDEMDRMRSAGIKSYSYRGHSKEAEKKAFDRVAPRLPNSSAVKEDYSFADEEEQINEMSGAGMNTRAIHKHLTKGGWSLTRTSGGHDVYTHPKATNHIAVPRHKGDLKAPLVISILKQSKINESSSELYEAQSNTKTQQDKPPKTPEKSDWQKDYMKAVMAQMDAEKKRRDAEPTDDQIDKMPYDELKHQRQDKQLFSIGRRIKKFFTKEGFENDELLETWNSKASNKTHEGEFQEKEHGKWFTYKKTNNPWALKHGLPHEIDVQDGVRYGHVKGTVAHIASDENADGTPEMNRWSIKNHTKWVKEGFENGDLQESRKSDIVKDAWKKAKSKKEETSEPQSDEEKKSDTCKDTFQRDPELDNGINKQ